MNKTKISVVDDMSLVCDFELTSLYGIVLVVEEEVKCEVRFCL